MSTPSVVVVPQEARPRTQKVGAPERLGRNAARTLAASQGHVWAAQGANGQVAAHTEVAAHVDARGDAIRARIWAHMDAALAACRRGAPAEAAAELHAARGLRALYEEADAAEDGHRACTARAAGIAGAHLGATVAIHGALLAAGVGACAG